MHRGQATAPTLTSSASTPEAETIDVVNALRTSYTQLGLVPVCDFVSLPDVNHIFLAPPPEAERSPTLNALWDFCIEAAPLWTPAEVESHVGAVINHNAIAEHYESLYARIHDLPAPLTASFLFTRYIASHTPTPSELSLDTGTLNLTGNSTSGVDATEDDGAQVCKITIERDDQEESDHPDHEFDAPTDVEPASTWQDILRDLPGVLELAPTTFALPAQATDCFAQVFNPPAINIDPEHYLFDTREDLSLI